MRETSIATITCPDAAPPSNSRRNWCTQVLEEAFMVLLVLQGGLSGSIHTDLSRVPAFICTAIVHVLRSSILRQLDQVRLVLARQHHGAHSILGSIACVLLEQIPRERRCVRFWVHVSSLGA